MTPNMLAAYLHVL